MAAPAYSINIAQLQSVSSPEEVGSPPAGYVWVVRCVVMTFGGYIGFVTGGFGLSSDGPWVLLSPQAGTQIISVRKQSSTWNGRVVVNPNETLWVATLDGDTADYFISGYQLSISGH